jgi:hypothetical protein
MAPSPPSPTTPSPSLSPPSLSHAGRPTPSLPSSSTPPQAPLPHPLGSGCSPQAPLPHHPEWQRPSSTSRAPSSCGEAALTFRRRSTPSLLVDACAQIRWRTAGSGRRAAGSDESRLDPVEVASVAPMQVQLSSPSLFPSDLTLPSQTRCGSIPNPTSPAELPSCPSHLTYLEPF